MNYYKSRFSLSIIVIMSLIFLLGYRAAFSSLTFSEEITQDSLDIDKYQWKNRLILVFADAKPHEAFEEQQRLLLQTYRALEEREVLVFCFADSLRTSEIGQIFQTDIDKTYRKRFNVPKNQFQIILIGKDGAEKLRKDSLTEGREILTRIDSMPMRQQEMKKTPE